MPAAVIGDMCTCVSPAPDSIVLGSMGVMIGGKPAARMGDMCAHGGMITVGCPTVLIGEMMPSMVPPFVLLQILPNFLPELAQKAAQIITLVKASENGIPLCERCS
jgi:hypothetical protein